MKNNLVKLLSLICPLIMLIALTGINVYADEVVLPSEQLMVQSDSLRLSVDKATGKLKLENLLNGDIWLSNPADAEEDQLASGITRTNLLSRLLVCYKNGNSLSYANDYSGSVINDGVTYKVSGNSILANYNFTDLEFVIPVEYSVKGNVFSAKILTEKITEGDKYLLNKIDFLPFFGAGGIADQGYMLIPDGCGAVINFNNGKTDTDSYSKEVFGKDISVQNRYQELNYENILIASFGIKKNNSAFIADISGGAGAAEINALISGQGCSYNRVYASFCYRNIQNIDSNDNTGNTVSGIFTAINSASSEEFCVNYTILDSQKADLAGMAEATYERLKAQGVSTETKPRLALDIYGGVKKEKALFGIRYTGTEKLTTYGDVLDILDSLNDIDISNVDIALKYFNTESVSGKISTGFDYSSKFGKKSDYKELLKKKGIYPYINLNIFSKGSLGYNRFFSSALGLNLIPVKVYDYSIQNRVYDEVSDVSYLISYTKLSKAVSSLTKNLEKQNLYGVSVDNLANTLYSDFSKKGILRDGAEKMVCGILDDICKDDTKLTMSAPNEYAFKYANLITDLPISSSGYAIFDYDVPFCQMSLHGLVDYTSESVNLAAMSRQQLLMIIRTGSQLKYSMIKNGGKSIAGTELEYLTSADFDDIKTTIVEWYNELAAVTKAVASSRMTYYYEKDGISVTEYKNNIKVYVNMTEQDCEVDGIKILSMDFTLVNQ